MNNARFASLFLLASSLLPRAAHAALPDCSEESIRAAAPSSAGPILDRAYAWIHDEVPYCQCVGRDGYRTDCSGFVSMAWGLPGPGHTTYSFAGGPWDDGVSYVINKDDLLIGDAYNFPGNFSQGTGHMVLFGGWLNDEHTAFCSLEESHSGTPARVITRWVDPAYLPIRSVDRQQCAPRCDGTVITDDGCGQGDCAAFGSRCVADNLGVRCAFAYCPDQGETDVCLDNGRIAHCSNGQLSAPGDCSVYGAHCVQDNLGGRCVFNACPAQGSADICLDENRIAHCENGQLFEPGDCSAFAARCSTAGADPTHARCVSVFCAASATEAPVARDGCWFENGALLHCNEQGAPTVEACPDGQQCSVSGGVHCGPALCPPTGETDVCTPAGEIGHCVGGSIIRATPCAGGSCSVENGSPVCVSMNVPGVGTTSSSSSSTSSGGSSGIYGASSSLGGALADASGGSSSSGAPSSGASADDGTLGTSSSGGDPADLDVEAPRDDEEPQPAEEEPEGQVLDGSCQSSPPSVMALGWAVVLALQRKGSRRARG